jgi:hypothetical protein
MTDIRWWLLMSLLVACVIGLIIWAHGADHHRGEDVGAVQAPYGASTTLGG